MAENTIKDSQQTGRFSMRRTFVIKDGRTYLAVVTVMAAGIYVIVSILLNPFGAVDTLGVVTAVILITAILIYWRRRRKW